MRKCLTIIQIELEFETCWFLRRGENRSTRRKTSQSKDDNQQQTQPTVSQPVSQSQSAPSSGIEPGPHWWEASALTTAPSLLPDNIKTIRTEIPNLNCSKYWAPQKSIAQDLSLEWSRERQRRIYELLSRARKFWHVWTVGNQNGSLVSLSKSKK